MPTARPRVLVTETDELTRAIAAAAARWPGESRSALVTRLAVTGYRALEADEQSQAKSRLSAIERWTAAFNDIYDPVEIAALREDWPA